MKEIKYKAWDKRFKRMVEIKDMMVGRTVSAWVDNPENSDYRHHLVHGENAEFLQFTGLKDKNGKGIFEGDIIRISGVEIGNDEISFLAKIEARSGGFWFQGNDFGMTDCNWHHYNESEREVIGNIYENPELVKL